MHPVWSFAIVFINDCILQSFVQQFYISVIISSNYRNKNQKDYLTVLLQT